MIQYHFTPKDGTYTISYSDLREKYEELAILSDSKFMERLPDAAHAACIIGWFKELGPDATIGDEGVVHEIIHLMVFGGNDYTIKKVRDKFDTLLKLE